jgi:hypothetical protein
MSDSQTTAPQWRPINDFHLTDGKYALLFFGFYENGEQAVEIGYRIGREWSAVNSQCGGVEECCEPLGWFPIPTGGVS